MHPVARLRLTVALGVWVVILFLFLLRGNLWRSGEGPAREPGVAEFFSFTVCLAAGFLLMPDFPVLGGGVLFAVCSLVLISSVCRAPH